MDVELPDDDEDDYPDDDPGSFVDIPPGRIAGLKRQAALNGSSVIVRDGLVFVAD